MKLIAHFILFSVYISVSHSSLYNEVKNNIISLLHRSFSYSKEDPPISNFVEDGETHEADVRAALSKSKLVKQAREPKDKVKDGLPSKIIGPNIGRQRYLKDPVLNVMRKWNFRRNKESSLSESSSLEMENWKDEWKEHWVQKKFEAINSSYPRGDQVNMLGARPWGVPCGDPNQHDAPWGSCMLPMECEPEYRIYRGDYLCGRTQFVCCALQLNAYDMYQGFDMSFADSGLSTDSEEKRQRNKGSKEQKMKNKLKAKKRRRRERLKRKRKIKRNIRRIIKEIRKILNRSYRNGTMSRKRKTKQLKAFIKNLKKQYKKDRSTVKNIHSKELENIDNRLQQKLDQIRNMNHNFIKNSTFRDIIVNGTITPQNALMLMRLYPEFENLLRGNKEIKRRSNNNQQKDEPLYYDIEYGYLYY